MKPPPFSSLLLLLPLLLLTEHALATSPLLPLLALKSALVDPLSSLHDWLPDSNFSQSGFHLSPSWCSWSGIQCDPATGLINSIDLSGRNLSGSIPPDIRHLAGLTRLNLSRNAFQGDFPTAVFELRRLEILDINHNSFNATFPRGVSNLKLLRVLNCFSNSFTGALPEDISGHRNLELLNLGGSYFDGPIPPGYGDLPKLTFLDLAGNSLSGSVPPELGQLSELEWIEIGYNANLSGEIPAELGGLKKLSYMDLSNSNISGEIPPELGNLTMLTSLLLFNNRLTGQIPLTVGGLTSLQILDLSGNQLTGEIPEGITLLKSLMFMNLHLNKLTGEIPTGIGDLSNLTTLQLWNNSLSGELPANLGANGKLERLDVSTNHFSGEVPANLCKGNKLVKLMLFDNRFSSELPKSLANCMTLNRVRVQGNNLAGEIPVGFGNLLNLTFMDLSGNNFTGPIPTDLGKSISLGTLDISRNNFNSELPRNSWEAPNLQIFSASDSGLIGELPDFSGCRSIYRIELGGNSLNGTIPWKIGHCQKLVSLNLAHNSLTGIIPWELSTLPAVTDVDLSDNRLNGTIPTNFNNCTNLEIFNVSFNLLTGPVPSSSAMLANLHPSSFVGNAGLCGKLIRKPCESDRSIGASQIETESRSPEKKKATGTAIIWITAAAFGVGLFVLLAGIRWFQSESANAAATGARTPVGPWRLTAFQRLNFTASDVLECLAMSDKIIGMGSTGTVYRAEMPGGETIAIKKLWGKNKETARRARRGSAVLAEVDVLGNVRHRNIVRLLGCCSNRETTMLLYEYMPNGSLDDLLHGRNKEANLAADWLTRYKIVLGVAQGICYLHHDCDPVIVHRDLKPSNILLDAELEARVADFGVAKLIQSDESMSVIAGSYGYIAPEYAYTLQVDEKSDIYSFGVVLLEILTGKRSVEPEFGDGNSIVDWVRRKLKAKDGVDGILDKNAGASCAPVREEMILVLRVALLCISRNPADRPPMRDVLSMLVEAKPQRKLPGSFGGDAGGFGGDAGGGGGGRRGHVIEINCGVVSKGSSSSFEQTRPESCEYSSA